MSSFSFKNIGPHKKKKKKKKKRGIQWNTDVSIMGAKQNHHLWMTDMIWSYYSFEHKYKISNLLLYKH